MKRIFFCDIDGTLLDGSRGMPDLSQETKYAIEELKKDNYVFLSSGRCKGLLNKQIRELKVDGYVLCNGAYVEFDNTEIFSCCFDESAIRKIRETVSSYDGFTIFETLNEMYVDSQDNEAYRKFVASWGTALEGFTEDKVMKGKYYIAMIGFEDLNLCDRIEAELNPYVDLARHHNGFPSYDVNIKGISKGIGVRKVIEYLKIPVEQCYAFGDGINDLEMLQETGHPVIMKNSDETLRKYGFEETDDVLENGFYRYLVRNKLIKEV